MEKAVTVRICRLRLHTILSQSGGVKNGELTAILHLFSWNLGMISYCSLLA